MNTSNLVYTYTSLYIETSNFFWLSSGKVNILHSLLNITLCFFGLS